METFRIKAYNKTSLAKLYCPYVSDGAARRNLVNWIRINPTLQHNLKVLGYDKNLRMLSPAMVRAIVDVVGEP